MSERLALHLLGPPKLELDGAPVIADRRKMLALLAYLGVNRWAHQRDHLSALLWPDYDQAKSYTNLRHILWEVQQTIGEGWIVARRNTIGFIPEGAEQPVGRVIWLDVVRFKALIVESHAQRDVLPRISLLAEAVTLYRNHFLTGFSLKDSPIFNRWAFTKSEELRNQLAHALTTLSEDHCSSSETETAIPYARQLVDLDPLNEASHRRLMRIYLQTGQPTAALKQYQTCERILRKVLGVDPQPETRLLYKQIRKGESKPLEPARVRTTDQTGHNLPFQISKFIGREKEMREVRDLIGDNRLVALVGTGGIGKTRLSLKVGEELVQDFSGGVWFVELAPLADLQLVPQSVGKLFHIVEHADEAIMDKLVRVLRPRSMLLILDNCEHVLEACARLADVLLHHCPRLKILATSREPLGITGEAQYQVPPWDYPHLITKDWDYGFRAQRIVDMITSNSGKIDMAYFQSMQGDSFDANGPAYVPLLLQMEELPDNEATAQNLLKDWDFQNRADSAAAAVFNAFWRHLLQNTFNDDLPEERYYPDGGSRWNEIMRGMDESSPWWDDKTTTEAQESRDDILRKSFEQGVAEVRDLLGRDPARWTWGEMHASTFRNGTLGESGVGPIESLFNRGPFPTGGGKSIVNATGWSVKDGYETNWLPSMRMIVDLGNLNNSVTVHTTGQSGHAYHPHYIDMAPLWANIEYYSMLWEEAAVTSDAEGHLVLIPR